jgi:hypothetical protein
MRILRTRRRARLALPLATMLGAAIGAVTALLVAPSPGSNLRRKIVKRGGNVAGRLIGESRGAIEKCGVFLREQGHGAMARLH